MAGGGPARHSWRISRAVAALALGASAAIAATACSPITTQVPYAPSDGARAVLGEELTVENLLVLTTAEGAPALVIGALTNRTDDTIDVSLVFSDTITQNVQVAGNDTVLLNPANPDGETVVIDASPAAPGASIPVTISTPTAGSTLAQVAALDGTLEPYGEYLELIE